MTQRHREPDQIKRVEANREGFREGHSIIQRVAERHPGGDRNDDPHVLEHKAAPALSHDQFHEVSGFDFVSHSVSLLAQEGGRGRGDHAPT